MTMFGKEVVVHPLNSDKVLATIRQKAFGETKSQVEQVSESVLITDKDQSLTECIKAIRHLEAGNSEYTCIEFFSDSKGITRLNVAHMQMVTPTKKV